MAGKILQLIDNVIKARAQGNPSLETTTKTKLLLKGIDFRKYTSSSEDDPEVIARIVQVAQEMNIQLKV